MSDVVHAFLESPQYKRGALFIVYDEWGGFFDHVRPPRVPDVRSSADVATDFGQMGMRIPAVLLSPYAKRNHVDHNIYGFESILKLIRYRFGLAPLTTRDQYARNIARSFDFDSKPNYEVPSLPDPPAVMASACMLRGHARRRRGPKRWGRDRPRPLTLDRPKEHDLAQLHTSGYLEKLGFDYKPATPSRTFRHPSKSGSSLERDPRCAGGHARRPCSRRRRGRGGADRAGQRHRDRAGNGDRRDAVQARSGGRSRTGALDIAAAPLTLGVKLAPECGGSWSDAGPSVLEKTLPNPTAAPPTRRR